MNAVVSVRHAYDKGAFISAAAQRFETVFGESGKDATGFLEQIWNDALADDLPGIALEDVVRLAEAFWLYGRRRSAGKILIRIRSTKRKKGQSPGRDILEVIGTDRPFLVDSVMGEIASQGLDVLAMFHPVVQVRRDENGDRVRFGGRFISESMIQVHLDLMGEAARARLVDGVRATLEDVRGAVDDWNDMRAEMDDAIDHLTTATTSASREEQEEAIIFLRWLRDNHFAFLGCRTYQFITDEKGDVTRQEPNVKPDSARGVLRDPERKVLRQTAEPMMLAPAIEAYIRAPSPVIVAKANMKSRVHRRAYMDYVGVKRYDGEGRVIGETRFVGLFTAEAYDRMAREVPLIRRKVRRVLDKAAKAPGSYAAKKLQNIVENYPRDELFQAAEQDLLDISLGILHLHDRPRTRLFMRRDQFDRFVSCLLFVPRDRYNSKVRELAGETIREAFNGRLSAFYPSFGDAPLARVHLIIGLDPFNHPEPDPARLEHEIVALARTWEDELQNAARTSGDEALRRAVTRYLEGYSAGYRERFNPDEALIDVARMERLGETGAMAARAYRLNGDVESCLRVKLYLCGEPVTLSGVMPVLENLGLRVLAEAGYPVQRTSDMGVETVWVHDFEASVDSLEVEKISNQAEPFEDALLAILGGQAEDDGFNKLILGIGIGWRQAAFLRTLARYRQQTGLDPSQSIQEEALAANPEIALGIMELADIKFSPALNLDMDGRRARARESGRALRFLLERVESLDHDRALRRILRLVEAVLRTNFYQVDASGTPKSRISLKISSRDVPELPEPKPYREIFVWSPRVEGVHIRFGPVARGGLRWSDRREDFRTEVLGLVKAQQVKNAVIVPVGSKGGFYPKQLPAREDRDAWLAEGQEAYRVFLRGLLDLTDNLVEDQVKRPDNVVCWDDEDPYFVVAADKGTATFSDLANTVAEKEYDFWLGDAFASGGSAGYDHKKMGITARGGWVSVQRHFREMGRDIQNDPFTVVGVGDMSGDVFGNGMLLSRQIKLVAAFDHRDIFIDPDPVDPERTWKERKRLFELGRSSWRNYDASLISSGGGIFSRSAKSITLTAEIQALTGLTDSAVSPGQLICALLKAHTELLWFGGIGTYVKATDEQNYQVGDRANDSLRIDASELKAKIIGEGANLGMTQAGRIEFARKGGRVNADFVDNSAGVDSSDHEVNIKILLNPIVREGAMQLEDRNTLLEEMTDTVAAHVLAHNYDQTLALTISREHAAADLDVHERMMAQLERDGRLDRKVEGLPSSEHIRELRQQGQGLTRPEIAVLISYAKITLFDALVACSVPDDAHFEQSLVAYFPGKLERFSDAMRSHRLKREIIATCLANDMVNLGGPTLVHRAKESTGADVNAIARAFEAGRNIFRFKTYTDRINALDNLAPASVQTVLHDEMIRLLRRQTHWLARRSLGWESASITDVINAYQPGVDVLKPLVTEIASPFDLTGVKTRFDSYVEAGAPENIARDVARLRPLTSSSDVIDLAQEARWPLAATAQLYHTVGARFMFDRLRAWGNQLSPDMHWDRLVMRRLIEDLYGSQYSLCSAAIAFAKAQGGDMLPDREGAAADWAEALVSSWNVQNEREVHRADRSLEEVCVTGGWTLSKIAICSTYLRDLAAVLGQDRIGGAGN